MKRFKDETEIDETFKSFQTIDFEERDKKEVYSKIMTSLDKEKKTSGFSRLSYILLTTAVVAFFLVGGAYFLLNERAPEQDQAATPNTPVDENKEDEKIELIESVLEIQFSGPDVKLNQLFDELSENSIPPTEYDVYLEELYRPYFTEEGLTRFIRDARTTIYQGKAYRNGFQLIIQNVDVTKNNETDGAFDFTVDVLYKKEGQEGNVATVTGRAYIYEEGKIADVTYYNDGGLMAALNKAQEISNYINTSYGMTFNLPKSWSGFDVIKERWEGQSISTNEVVESGPLFIFRHPDWTEENPRQDIPILIFTKEQWESIQKEEFHIGAAPVGPSELRRNNKYVFALPARYNYAFPEGYEEVEEILESGAFKVQEVME